MQCNLGSWWNNSLTAELAILPYVMISDCLENKMSSGQEGHPEIASNKWSGCRAVRVHCGVPELDRWVKACAAVRGSVLRSGAREARLFES